MSVTDEQKLYFLYFISYRVYTIDYNIKILKSIIFQNIKSLKVTHKYGDLVDLKGKVFAFGGYRSFETEVYDQESNTWTLYKEIPFRDFGGDKPYFYHMTVGPLSTQINCTRPVLHWYYFDNQKK